MSPAANPGDCERENRCTFDQACELYATCAHLDPNGAWAASPEGQQAISRLPSRVRDRLTRNMEKRDA